MEGCASDDLTDGAQRPMSEDESVYFVPYWWWREAQKPSSGDDDESRGILYTAVSTSYGGPMKIINNIFYSDLVFNLRRKEDSGQNDHAEEGISGRDYALVPGEMWLQALKWHSDSNVTMKDGRSFLAVEDDIADVYPLQLRLSVIREAISLAVKISKKDNTTELYKRACKIFSIESELVHIWDFSGQLNLFFITDRNKSPKDGYRLSEEILLKLQVYGLSDSMKCREGRKNELAVQQSKMAVSSCGSSLFMNGSIGESGSLGLTGLQNLGNTCFMNSAIQCLAHTPKLVDYFLGDYSREINTDNPLGMDGELALAFGDLLQKLWAPWATPLAPRVFKSKLAHFAPQFSGFSQHDSQELLAFLLDGLHEDLNRVKCKPYIEVKDADGRPDGEVADEYWRNHLARNDSIIVDVCQGQYRSTLVCPVCRKVSVTFDPFMYLSLPLPSTTMRTITVTVLGTDGTTLPCPVTVNVPKVGYCKDLIQALSKACSLRSDETLLVAEIYANRIIRYLEEPADSLSLIRDDDRLVAYRLPKDLDRFPLVVFMHQRVEQYNHGKATTCMKAFGIPLVLRLCNVVNGSDIRYLFLKLLNSFLMHDEGALDTLDDSENNAKDEINEMEDTTSLGSGGNPADEMGDGQLSDPEFQFYPTDERCTVKDSKIEMNEPLLVTALPKRFFVLVSWPSDKIEQYDTCLLSSLPEVFKSSFIVRRPQESVSLYACLEAFLKEEPLGPEDMWYCPGCKKPQQASKKLDLWRLPEIFVIHLKRFSYSRFLKNKLETYVDFPIHDLDLSTYISHNNIHSSNRYMLYAVSNHYGGMGGGHYTAFVHHGGNQWYEFDDSHVFPVCEEKIKTSAAYVLFYRRVMDE
ncbi:ubiquitin carboxyl-terminal hydrolase 8-like [Macadamia integrifolia]|uniref:ubiquitin carboxyl-terminal hydrolase 8-like n=1 Tax=Macadamia integrifolia TaxID=60698 RepID=UPI001C4F0EE1|nr:ubiquitin carboxyl-terminal hydrolase 8-like [Macadamia integrifolia]